MNTNVLSIEGDINLHFFSHLVSSPSTNRPGFTSASAPPTAAAGATRSTTSTSWTAQVSKVYLQLGRYVIGWFPEVRLILSLNRRRFKSCYGLQLQVYMILWLNVRNKAVFFLFFLPWAPQPQPRTLHLSVRKGKDSIFETSEQRNAS